MKEAWSRLLCELDAWQVEDKIATFWWRDDDARSHTDPLARLITLADDYDVPLALSVIPCCDRSATDTIARSTDSRNVTVFQHGYAHRNHNWKHSAKSEFPWTRGYRAVDRELERGLFELTRVFGDRFLPVLAPPWNHLCQSAAARLPQLGFIGLSLSGPRGHSHLLPRCNVHVDILSWGERPSFRGTEQVCDDIARQLRERRAGTLDPEEPIGVMTHHLNHDEPAWWFMDMLFRQTKRHPAARWLAPDSLFALYTANHWQAAPAESAGTRSRA